MSAAPTIPAESSGVRTQLAIFRATLFAAIAISALVLAVLLYQVPADGLGEIAGALETVEGEWSAPCKFTDLGQPRLTTGAETTQTFAAEQAEVIG